jgi:hypothetical protein
MSFLQSMITTYFTPEELDAEIKHRKPGTQVAVRYRSYSRIYDTSLVVGSGR